MALNDLVEDTSLSQFSDGEEEETETTQYHTTHADFNKKEKPCPSCRCISQKKPDSKYWYECPYPGCGVVLFMAGWNEKRPDFWFLGEVEIKGWRYEEDGS